MELRHYSQSEEQEVIDLWNRACIADALDASKFRKQAILDENFDEKLSWVAIEDGKVVGFIYGTKRKFPYLERGLEPDRGWINVLFVDPMYENRGIGSKLLKKCEDALTKLGCKNITLGAYSPNYFFWGVDTKNYQRAIKFFEAKGYIAQEEHYSMGKDLHGYRIPEEIIKRKELAQEQGYKFVSFDYKYTLELLEFLRVEFGGGWKRNALNAMRQEIAEDVIQLVLDKEDRICGFCMRAIDGNPMRFGPIGIAKAHRNTGIGTILLDIQCYEMSKAGIYRMYFVTTDEPGRRYYERQGIEVFRTFMAYKKELLRG